MGSWMVHDEGSEIERKDMGLDAMNHGIDG
jgi:hypothetical protein